MSTFGKMPWDSLIDEVNTVLESKRKNPRYISRLYSKGLVELYFVNEEDAALLSRLKSIPLADGGVPLKLKIGSVLQLVGHGSLVIIDADSLEVYMIVKHSKYGVGVLIKFRCPQCANPSTFAENMIICEQCNEVLCNTEKVDDEQKELKYLHLTLKNGTIINGDFG